MEDWKFHNTYSGTPQGGTISPIPANIYLDSFDKYMNEYTQTFDKLEYRRRSSERKRLETKKYSMQRNLKVETDENIRKQLMEKIRVAEKEWVKIPCGDAMDKNRRRLKYVTGMQMIS